MEKKELPKGWIEATLESISDITLGRSPPSSTYNKEKRGLPFYQGKADFGDIYPTARTWCDQPQTFAEQHDILMSVRAPVGSTNISTETCSIGRGLAAIRPLKIAAMMFVFYQIRRLEHTISQQGIGTTFKAITGKQVRSIPIIIPPLQEQHRIVQKIESIFAKIDARQKELERLETQLKSAPDSIHMLKSSILKLAFEGTLVPQDPNDEPASILLEKIQSQKSAKI